MTPGCNGSGITYGSPASTARSWDTCDRVTEAAVPTPAASTAQNVAAVLAAATAHRANRRRVIIWAPQERLLRCVALVQGVRRAVSRSSRQRAPSSADVRLA